MTRQELATAGPAQQAPEPRDALGDEPSHSLGDGIEPVVTVPPFRLHSLRRRSVRNHALDAVAIAIAALDVWLYVPADAPPYSLWLSTVAVGALLLRRRLPFVALLATVPGFMVGWSQLAAMIALGFLAYRKGAHWQMWLGAGLVLACRFVLWPLPEMAKLSWGEHALSLIYGCIVAGMPVALALLILARRDLAGRLAELNASRDRERLLHGRTVRADERARLAREMHDVVSHQVTLIAMQANALAAANTPQASAAAAERIRALSTRTLEELRSLVGVLRSPHVDGAPPQHGVQQIGDLVRDAVVPVQLTVDGVPDTLPAPVSAAAYRTVQEALTNTYKHAPGATAAVTLRVDGAMLVVAIRNDRPRVPPATRTTAIPSGGHGLAGLAERALHLNGGFHARATDDGGFEVSARYPLVS